MINMSDKLFSNGSYKQTCYNSAKVSEINVLHWVIVALTTQRRAPKGSSDLCWSRTPPPSPWYQHVWVPPTSSNPNPCRTYRRYLLLSEWWMWHSPSPLGRILWMPRAFRIIFLNVINILTKPLLPWQFTIDNLNEITSVSFLHSMQDLGRGWENSKDKRWREICDTACMYVCSRKGEKGKKGRRAQSNLGHVFEYEMLKI